MEYAHHPPGPSARLAELRLAARMPSAALRALPDFVIVGTQKGGTTSLYDYLGRHPGVVPALRKEVHFFDLHFGRGVAWYRAHFPPRARLTLGRCRGGRRSITGEASPYYLFHPMVPARLRAVVPTARVIVLLRRPVERAFSHYRHEVRAGREHLSFEEALAAEDRRLDGEHDRLSRHPEAVSDAHRHASYASRGLYADQLTGWFRHFPRQQVLVLASEALFERPAQVYRQTLDFLGLALSGPMRFPVRNQGHPLALAPGARATLEERFAEPHRRLVAQLGFDPWDAEQGA